MKNPALDPARRPDETQEQYRARLKYNNKAIKRHLRGQKPTKMPPEFKRKILSYV